MSLLNEIDILYKNRFLQKTYTKTIILIICVLLLYDNIVVSTLTKLNCLNGVFQNQTLIEGKRSIFLCPTSVSSTSRSRITVQIVYGVPCQREQRSGCALHLQTVPTLSLRYLRRRSHGIVSKCDRINTFEFRSCGRTPRGLGTRRGMSFSSSLSQGINRITT